MRRRQRSPSPEAVEATETARASCEQAQLDTARVRATANQTERLLSALHRLRTENHLAELVRNALMED